MRFRHLQFGMLIILVVLCLVMNWLASTRQTVPEIYDTPQVVIERSHEKCPPCELFFRKLAESGEDGKLVQEVKVQQRGEPKSGTSFMYDWATATLLRTCDYLKYLFGEDSCRIELKKKGDHDAEQLGRAANRRMVFQPALGSSNARCSCDTIERVSIELSDLDKHTLPVNHGCAYSHARGIDFGLMKGDFRAKNACKFHDGRRISSQDDLWQCMHEADCEFVDDWLQMAVFRDPRPAVVSSYFHIKRLARVDLPSLEEFVAAKLPIMCQWLAVRYTLFSGSLSYQSTEFWYRKALANPLGWHHRWFDMVGLQLPFNIVNDTANGAVNYDFRFNKKHIDEHPGEEPSTNTGAGRRFEDQVSESVLNKADEILRAWLPPVLLEQLGVAPPPLVAVPPNLGAALPQIAVAPRQLGVLPPQRAVAPPQLAVAQPQQDLTPPRLAVAPPQLTEAPPQLAAAPPQRAVATPQRAVGPRQVTVAPPQMAVARPHMTALPPQSAAVSPATRSNTEATRNSADTNRSNTAETRSSPVNTRSSTAKSTTAPARRGIPTARSVETEQVDGITV